MAFDNGKFLIFRALQKIREENNLEDNEDIIEKKIQLIVENIHNDRNSKFDNFNYRGEKLSEYVNEAWVRRIVNLMMSELYAEAFDTKRAMSNIDLAYQSFKVEFYKNLTRK
jgi:Txe/YoeB family toxin of Txe-Axe toxin-antitoxin module